MENSRNLSENSKIDFDLSLPKEDRNIDCFTVKKKIYESRPPLLIDKTKISIEIIHPIQSKNRSCSGNISDFELR